MLPARLGKPQRGSALAGEDLVGALRLENHFLKSARIEPKFLCCSLMINVETGWKYGRVSQENLFVYTPPCCTPLITLPGVI
jgi:hypothetical protein